MYNERYCSEVELQILNCIREGPKDSETIRLKLGIDETIRPYTCKLKRLNLIYKVKTNSHQLIVWGARNE